MTQAPARPVVDDPRDRIIFALDVATKDEASRLVDELEGLISFYKVGLELLISGGTDELLRRLSRNHRVFVDLKLPNDIPETVKRAVHVAADQGASFLTLSSSVTPTTIRAALEGRGQKTTPKLLYVPLLSSEDRSELVAGAGDRTGFERAFVGRAENARAAGADGFIVSGQEIRLLRARFPEATLVSPGIRPAGSATNDHKRSATPAEAVRLGADYLVVGRPIRDATDRRAAAERIIAELGSA